MSRLRKTHGEFCEKVLGVPNNHRCLKFLRWFSVYFVARLLSIEKSPLSPSQKTEVFQDSRK
jgi:hypothetical protein